MRDFLAVVLIILGLPVLWQVPRTFWPVRLNADRTRFTGLYRRYKVQTFTGNASEVRASSSEVTHGSVSAHGTIIGSTVAMTTHDNRKTFTEYHSDFFLTDATGRSQAFRASNVGASIGNGHRVSVAQLVHNGRPGNTFLVYNHTTDLYYTEQTRRGMKNAERGLTKMVLRLPLALQVILFVALVTIPLMIVFGVGGHWQLRRFRKRRHGGIRDLVTSFNQAAALLAPVASAAIASPPSAAGPPDLVAQIQQITELHRAGALTSEEFQLAKERILNAGSGVRNEQFAPPPAPIVHTPPAAF